MTAPVRYTIQATQPAAHLFEVTLSLTRPDPAGQVFSLPAWIPGSYMIREFAKNIVSLSARAGGKAVPVTKRDKLSWQLPAGIEGPLTLTYTVYAWDLSVRTAHLDPTHGFFNGTSVFLCAHGHENAPQRVDIRPPEGLEDAGWRVAVVEREVGIRFNGKERFNVDACRRRWGRRAPRSAMVSGCIRRKTTTR